MLSRDGCIDTLRLSDTEKDSIIEALDRASPNADGNVHTARRHRRYRYVVRDGLCVQIDGSTSRYVVRPRNLSAGGISFLHGSFLYPGTPCIVTLKTIDGENVLASGHVVRCRLVHGRTHEVAVGFHELIDIENFVALDSARVKDPGREPPPPLERGYPVADVLRGVDELRRLIVNNEPQQHIVQKLSEIVGMLRLQPA